MELPIGALAAASLHEAAAEIGYHRHHESPLLFGLFRVASLRRMAQ
jgi:hypothetical protein